LENKFSNKITTETCTDCNCDRTEWAVGVIPWILWCCWCSC